MFAWLLESGSRHLIKFRRLLSGCRQRAHRPVRDYIATPQSCLISPEPDGSTLSPFQCGHSSSVTPSKEKAKTPDTERVNLPILELVRPGVTLPVFS